MSEYEWWKEHFEWKEYIKSPGGCIISKRILNGEAPIRWMFRVEPLPNFPDNGWRFFSDIDGDEYVNNPDNLTVCDYNTVISMAPVALLIYDFPVGTDLQLCAEEDRIVVYDNVAEKELDLDKRGREYWNTFMVK